MKISFFYKIRHKELENTDFWLRPESIESIRLHQRTIRNESKHLYDSIKISSKSGASHFVDFKRLKTEPDATRVTKELIEMLDARLAALEEDKLNNN